jgi:hypothetical protein
MDGDENAYQRQNNIYYPFSERKEWELGKFLSETLTQSQIDRYLKLQWVSCWVSLYSFVKLTFEFYQTKDNPPSFGSAIAL